MFPRLHLHPPDPILDWTAPFKCAHCGYSSHPNGGRLFKPINTFGRLQCRKHVSKWSRKHKYWKCCENSEYRSFGCEKMDHTDQPRDWYFLQNKEIELLKENSWNPDETKKSNNILQIDEVKKVDGIHDLTYMCVRLNTNCRRSSILNMYNNIMKDVRIHREEDFLYQNNESGDEEIQRQNSRRRGGGSGKRKRKATSPPDGERSSKRRRILPNSSSTTTLRRKKKKKKKKKKKRKRKRKKVVRPQDVVNRAIVIDE